MDREGVGGEEAGVVTCETCRWWEPSEHHDEKGRCRREPPARASREEHGEWPLTYLDDWCGEHRARDEGDPPVEGKVQRLG